MGNGALRVFLVFLCSTAIVTKIILPHKLRYLENMLNAEVVAKAAKIRQGMEANPNQDNEKSWPMLLAKYQADDKKKMPQYNSYGFYGRRMPLL